MAYGFYEVVYRWLKPKAKRTIHEIRRLVPKIPKRKPRVRTTSPQDIVSEVHKVHASPERTFADLLDKYPLAKASLGQTAQAAQILQRTNQAESDLFWKQIAMECQKITGSTDFKSYDRDLGKKKGFLE